MLKKVWFVKSLAEKGHEIKGGYKGIAAMM